MSVHVKVWDDAYENEDEGDHVIVAEGDYHIVVTAPAHESVQAFANGTHVITVTNRKVPA